MAGTLVVNGSATWMPAGWVYDYVLTKAAERLGAEHLSLSGRLSAATTESSVGYLDLGELNLDEFRAFSSAVRSLAEQALRDGPDALADPSFFDGLVARIAELVRMIDEDPRAGL